MLADVSSMLADVSSMLADVSSTMLVVDSNKLLCLKADESIADVVITALYLSRAHILSCFIDGPV